MPTDFCSHSMLHQTLLTFGPFSSSSSSSTFHHSLSSSPAILSSSFSLSAGRFLSSSSSSQVEMEAMKGMLASAHEQVFMVDEVDEAAWAAERVNLLAEEFQVDDLLDLRGLPESEQDEMEEEEDDEYAVPIAVSEVSVSPVKSTPAAEKEPLELCSEICLPETDAAALEWVSRFFDDSAAEFPPPLPPGPALAPLPKYFFASAATPPASLSCTTAAAGSLSTEAAFPVKAKRSKRLRGDGGVWSRSAPPRLSDASSASSLTTAAASSPSSSSCSSSSFTSYIFYEPSPAAGILLIDNSAPSKEQKPKKRGRKPKNPLATLGERRCTHCGVQKTPQWRAGPRGAKTLCNACGVRFKSGRLLPEYRPACSPTFLSDVHSNSHRKVLEMRRKKEEHEILATSAPPVSSY